MGIHDGFVERTVARLDLDPLGDIHEVWRIRSGYALVAALKAAGPSGTAVSESGLVVVKQDGIPSHYALVLAVAPFSVPAESHANDVLPKPGDIVVKSGLYAGESLSLQENHYDHLPDMERSTQGLLLLDLQHDILAIDERTW